MWGFTPEESNLYLEQCGRDMLFREAVIGFLGADTNKSKSVSSKSGKAIGEYCQGKDVKECHSYFGDYLVNICASCPQ
jgi:hypothetical protein